MAVPRRAVLALAVALGGLALLLATWYGAFHVGLLARADRGILRGFTDLSRPRLDALAGHIASLCNPTPWIYLAAAVLGIALFRRRFRAATAIATVLLGANVTTHLLKPLLAASRPAIIHGQAQVFGASWPSGHATASMSLTLCLVLAVPRRMRPAVAALGALFTVAVVFSFLILAWHFPSDVLGGFLVAGTWTVVAVACVWLADGSRAAAPGGLDTAIHVRRRRGGRGDPRPSWGAALAPPALALAAAAGLAALVAVARPREVADYVHTHHGFAVGAVVIAVTALAIATAVMLAVSRTWPGGSGPAATAAPRRRSPPG